MVLCGDEKWTLSILYSVKVTEYSVSSVVTEYSLKLKITI